MSFPRRRSGSGFWTGVLAFLALVGLMFGIAGMGYVWYRIMAPELGWHVPDFWAVFWSTVFISIPLGILGVMRSD